MIKSYVMCVKAGVSIAEIRIGSDVVDVMSISKISNDGDYTYIQGISVKEFLMNDNGFNVQFHQKLVSAVQNGDVFTAKYSKGYNIAVYTE